MPLFTSYRLINDVLGLLKQICIVVVQNDLDNDYRFRLRLAVALKGDPS